MLAIGKTIKSIRKLKGLTQNEVYYGIISRSFINRFERGENDIQAGKLLVILDNLGISPSEFKYIHEQRTMPILNQNIKRINILYQKKDFAQITSFINQNKDNNDNQITLAVGFAELALNTYFYKTFPMTNHIQKFIYHILNAENWTIQEIDLVQLIIPTAFNYRFNLNISIEEIVKKVELNCQLYQNFNYENFDINSYLIDFYGTLFQGYLNFDDYEHAKQIKTKLNSLNTSQDSLDILFKRHFWLNIWELYFGDFEHGHLEIENSLHFLEAIGNNHNSIEQAIFNIRLAEARHYRQK